MFGIDEASVMGLNVRKYQSGIILAGTILTAIVVSFCGRIGFIGFMVPLIVRRFIGSDMRRLLPVSILAGAIILTVIYDIAYLIGVQDNISIVTGSIGCCVMLFTLLRGGGKMNAAREDPGRF